LGVASPSAREASLGECVELLFERVHPLGVEVLLKSHLEQEGFDPREAPGDGLHDGGDDWRS
jgi:hypothetical protein